MTLVLIVDAGVVLILIVVPIGVTIYQLAIGSPSGFITFKITIAIADLYPICSTVGRRSRLVCADMLHFRRLQSFALRRGVGVFSTC